MALALHGLGVARGLVIGDAMVLDGSPTRVVERTIAVEKIEAEVTRYRSALTETRRHWTELRGDLQLRGGADLAALLDVHILMLSDKSFAVAPVEVIRSRHCNAEWALKLQRDQLVANFAAMDDDYLRSRQADVDHVVMGVQRALLSESAQAGATMRFGAVVVAEELSPAEVIALHQRGAAGFVTELGGANSHTAIIARSLGLPALVGAHGARQFVRDGESVVLDGWNGALWAEIDERALHYFRSRQEQEEHESVALQNLVGRPARTRDHVHIGLHANVELLEDLPNVARVAADGIGLFRTEMLFLNRDYAPTEQDQLDVYCSVIAAARGGVATIRTLDIGVDKIPSWFNASAVSAGPNPALGLRGVRWCLAETALFRTQLRAILRAAVDGRVRIMLPMLTVAGEVQQVRALMDECAAQLQREGLAHRADIPVGGMVEVPAAALAADHIARHVDFMSIGTNDLIQYTLAADRVDDTVSHLYDPLHPAVLSLIRMTIDAGARAGIPVAMCGEMAGDVRYTRLLLGLGLREFSMHPAFLLEIKKVINSSDANVMKQLVDTMLANADPASFSTLVEALNV